jgi:hypothetical protein
MTPFAAFMEITMVCPVKEIQAIQNVLASVRVDNIKEDYKTKTMCRVYELFEILRDTIARAGSEKVGNLISECWKQVVIASAVTWRKILTCVISMLHYGHKLDAIVSEILYPG